MHITWGKKDVNHHKPVYGLKLDLHLVTMLKGEGVVSELLGILVNVERLVDDFVDDDGERVRT